MRVGRAKLYFETLRHLKPQQWIGRARRSAQLVLEKSAPIQRRYVTHATPPIATTQYPTFVSQAIPLKIFSANFFDLERAKQVKNGTFRFLSHSHRMESNVDWNGAGNPKLWTYNLHYFDYFRDLAIARKVTGDHRYYEVVKGIASDWIESNPIGSGDGWEPYPISLRIRNWIQAYELLRDDFESDTGFRDAFLKSLHSQGHYLSYHLETHLLANHYLENLASLVWFALFFETTEAQKMRQPMLKSFLRQVEEQVLPGGSHFELSPMYHLIMLQVVFETTLRCEHQGVEVPRWLPMKIREMAEFTCATAHPDGQIPLLNDSAFGISLSPAELIPAIATWLESWELARAYPTFSFYAYHHFGEDGCERFGALWEKARIQPAADYKVASHSDYVVFRDSDNYLVFDCAPVGPDYNPGHAHADTLSFEYSSLGRRWFVDSGVYQYEFGRWREYFRSTAAHNTVEVDGLNQSEVWGSFRVARRARAQLVELHSTDGYDLAAGVHDGYSRLKDPVHHLRCILHDRTHSLWLVLDVMAAEQIHHYVSRLHLAHDLEVEKVDEDSGSTASLRVVDKPGGHQCIVLPFGFDSTGIVQASEDSCEGWVSTEFGVKHPSKLISMSKKAEGPTVMGYFISHQPVELALKKVGVEMNGDFELSYKLDGQMVDLSGSGIEPFGPIKVNASSTS